MIYPMAIGNHVTCPTWEQPVTIQGIESFQMSTCFIDDWIFSYPWSRMDKNTYLFNVPSAIFMSFSPPPSSMALCFTKYSFTKHKISPFFLSFLLCLFFIWILSCFYSLAKGWWWSTSFNFYSCLQYFCVRCLVF
jgi:hypothetical protein